MVAPPGSVNDSSTAFEPTAGGRGANRTAIMQRAGIGREQLIGIGGERRRRRGRDRLIAASEAGNPESEERTTRRRAPPDFEADVPRKECVKTSHVRKILTGQRLEIAA